MNSDSGVYGSPPKTTTVNTVGFPSVLHVDTTELSRGASAAQVYSAVAM